MKNTIKLAGFALVLAILVLSFAACANGTTDSGDDSGGSSGGITITDIPARYEGMYVRFEMGTETLPTLTGARELKDGQLYFAQIRGGKVTIPLWINISGLDSLTERYLGNDTYTGELPSSGLTGPLPSNGIGFLIILEPSMSVSISSSSKAYCIGFFEATVTFSSGSAALSWNDAGYKYESDWPTPAEEGNTTVPTRFEGRWHNEESTSPDYSYTFKANTFTFNDSGNNISYSGSFSSSDTLLTFRTETNGEWTQGYTLDGNVLTLSSGGGHPYGEFTKQ